MHKIAMAGTLAVVVLTATACASQSPVGPPYVAPHKAVTNPAITTQDGVTTPAEEFGGDCTQLDSRNSLSSIPTATAIARIPMLSTFTNLVNKAELTGELNHDSALTVIAPSNDAWTALRHRLGPTNYTALINNNAALNKLLRYSLAVHRYSKAGLLNQGALATLQGASVHIQRSADTMTLADNTRHSGAVLCGNIPTANATVFIVDTVLMPDYPGAGDPGDAAQS